MPTHALNSRRYPEAHADDSRDACVRYPSHKYVRRILAHARIVTRHFLDARPSIRRQRFDGCAFAEVDVSAESRGEPEARRMIVYRTAS